MACWEKWRFGEFGNISVIQGPFLTRMRGYIVSHYKINSFTKEKKLIYPEFCLIKYQQI